MVIKIAIAGKAKSGKNTLASLLKDNLEKQLFPCRIFAFADPIKKIAMKMFPLAERDWFWGPSENRNTIIPDAYNNGNPLTCRQLLLDIGKFGRKYNPNIWVNSTMDDIDLFVQSSNINSVPNVPIVSDLRFKEEISALRKSDFYLIRIKRSKADAKINDISETDLDDISDSEFNEIIQNDDNIESLKWKAARLAKDLAFFK